MPRPPRVYRVSPIVTLVAAGLAVGCLWLGSTLADVYRTRALQQLHFILGVIGAALAMPTITSGLFVSWVLGDDYLERRAFLSRRRWPLSRVRYRVVADDAVELRVDGGRYEIRMAWMDPPSFWTDFLGRVRREAGAPTAPGPYR